MMEIICEVAASDLIRRWILLLSTACGRDARTFLFIQGLALTSCVAVRMFLCAVHLHGSDHPYRD